MENSTRFANVDWSGWPVIVITYPPIATVEGVAHLFAEVGARTGNTPFAIVGDLRPIQLATANARVRAAFAEHAARDDRTFLVAEAAVVGSPVARGLVTAYQWISPRSHPTSVFESVEAAVAWARGVLEQPNRG